MAAISFMKSRNNSVDVSVNTTGDTVTSVTVVNNDSDPAYLTVLNGATTIIDNVLCPAGQTTTQNIQKNKQFAWATNPDWTIGVGR